MPASTFSLFPSAKDGVQGHKSADVPVLSSRQSMLEYKRAGAYKESSTGVEQETYSAGPVRSRTSGDTRRESIISKESSSTRTTVKQNTQIDTSSAEAPAEQAYSPESYTNPSLRSTSPTLVASSRCSTSTLKARRKQPPSSIAVDKSTPMRSIFPTYDPELLLEEQYYLPTQTSPTNIPWEQVCKAPYSPDFFPSETKEASERSGLLFTAPKSSKSNNMYTPEIELPALWELSNGRANSIAKSQTYRLQMHRSTAASASSKKIKKRKGVGLEPLLTFGPSSTAPFLSVFSEKCKDDCEEKPDQIPQRVRIRKHNLSRFDPKRDHYADSSTLVSDLTLASDALAKSAATSGEQTANSSQEDSNISSITPHKSILDSLSLAGTSSAAAELASVDPGASSIAAANLAERAMNAARAANTCSLVFTNVPGMRQRGYALKHPSHGLFRIQIEGDVRLHDENPSQGLPKGAVAGATAKPKPAGNVKIVAPVPEKHLYDYSCGPLSSRPFKPPTKVLAEIDLATATLSLHGAELTDLNDRYIVDTAVSALIGVILAETAVSRMSHLTSFAPPPTKAVTDLAIKSVAKYKYFPLIRTQKPKKQGRREKTAAEVEENLSVAFGAVVFVLGAAVDGLATWADRVKQAGEAPVQERQA